MDKHKAFSLADFINERSLRYQANVFPFSDKGWVIVRDRHDDQRLEPIANLHHYLQRVCDGVVQIDPSYHYLLLQWVRDEGDENDENDEKLLLTCGTA